MFDFDICAPHIAIPECFTDENSVMVVFDLGRLQFRNLCPKLMLNAPAEQKQSPDDEGNMLAVAWQFVLVVIMHWSRSVKLLCALCCTQLVL